MRLPGKAIQDQLERIKTNVECAAKSFEKNVERFNAFKEFVFKDTITSEDASNLTSLDLPKLRGNILEPFISRLRGEFAQNHPDLKVHSPNESDPDNVEMIPVVSGILRGIAYRSSSDDVDNKTITNMLSGGYDVQRIKYDYNNETTLDQSLFVETVYDPTLCGFDPEATTKHKGDGRFCYTFYPKRLADLKKEYPNATFLSSANRLPFASAGDSAVSWSWIDNKTQEKMILICEYFEKVYTETEFVRLASDGSTVTIQKFEQMLEEYNPAMGEVEPCIIGKPVTRKVVDHIQRFIVASSHILEQESTVYDSLPLVFFDGNGVNLKNKHMTRPYIYNAMDTQRARNLLFNQFMDEVQNLRKTTVLTPEAALPDNGDYLQAYLNPTKAKAALVYKHETVDAQSGEARMIPSPQVFPRAPIPPELFMAFEAMKSEVQSQLGAYDSQLGIQNNEISGAAIIAGATQANAAAKPYIINYIASMNQVARILVNLIPKIYNTPRTIPIVMADGKRSYQLINDPDPDNPNSIKIDYKPNDLDIIVEEGVNFEVERQQAIQDLVSLSQTFPALSQLMNTPAGIEVLLENLQFKGVEKLKELVEQQASQPTQPPPPNPQMIAAQNAAQKNQIAQEKLGLEKQKMGMNQQKMGMDQDQFMAKMMLEKAKLETKIQNDQTKTALTLDRQHLEEVNQNIKKYKIVLDKVHDLHKEYNDGQADY